MSVFGIVTCEILESEFAYILSGDRDIEHITVIGDKISKGFTEFLKGSGYENYSTIPHVSSFMRSTTGNEVLVKVLELGLHRKCEVLRNSLAKTLRDMNRYVDAFCLGYGLCGNALKGIGHELNTEKPVLIPHDKAEPVDDCVSLIIGGRERYYEEQKREAGTFFLTPGWAGHWADLFMECKTEKERELLINRFFSRYKRALLITDPVMTRDTLINKTEEFIKLTGLKREFGIGTLSLIEENWNSCKSALKVELAK